MGIPLQELWAGSSLQSREAQPTAEGSFEHVPGSIYDLLERDQTVAAEPPTEVAEASNSWASIVTAAGLSIE